MSIQTYKALVKLGRNSEPSIQEFPLPNPGPDQVLVKIHSTPINPSTVLRLNGKFGAFKENEPNFLGGEGSGIIVALGEDLKISHKIGDKVHVLGMGTFGEYLLATLEQVFPIKGDLGFEQAACHFSNSGTVLYMAHTIVKDGHKAAIHTAGSSALGRMLIRYFKHKGIKLINIVRKDEYIEELKAEGADYVLNSTAPDFEAKLG